MKQRIYFTFILLFIAASMLSSLNSCVWKGGCTDSDAVNYDIEATIDDGDCVYNQKTFAEVSSPKSAVNYTGEDIPVTVLVEDQDGISNISLAVWVSGYINQPFFDQAYTNSAITSREAKFDFEMEDDVFIEPIDQLGYHLIHIQVTDANGEFEELVDSIEIRDLAPPSISFEGFEYYVAADDFINLQIVVNDFSGIEEFRAEVWKLDDSDDPIIQLAREDFEPDYSNELLYTSFSYRFEGVSSMDRFQIQLKGVDVFGNDTVVFTDIGEIQ